VRQRSWSRHITAGIAQHTPVIRVVLTGRINICDPVSHLLKQGPLWQFCEVACKHLQGRAETDGHVLVFCQLTLFDKKVSRMLMCLVRKKCCTLMCLVCFAL